MYVYFFSNRGYQYPVDKEDNFVFFRLTTGQYKYNENNADKVKDGWCHFFHILQNIYYKYHPLHCWHGHHSNSGNNNKKKFIKIRYIILLKYHTILIGQGCKIAPHKRFWNFVGGDFFLSFFQEIQKIANKDSEFQIIRSLRRFNVGSGEYIVF